MVAASLAEGRAHGREQQNAARSVPVVPPHRPITNDGADRARFPLAPSVKELRQVDRLFSNFVRRVCCQRPRRRREPWLLVASLAEAAHCPCPCMLTVTTALGPVVLSTSPLIFRFVSFSFCVAVLQQVPIADPGSTQGFYLISQSTLQPSVVFLPSQIGESAVVSFDCVCTNPYCGSCQDAPRLQIWHRPPAHRLCNNAITPGLRSRCRYEDTPCGGAE